jgi:hypothetical protein
MNLQTVTDKNVHVKDTTMLTWLFPALYYHLTDFHEIWYERNATGGQEDLDQLNSFLYNFRHEVTPGTYRKFLKLNYSANTATIHERSAVDKLWPTRIPRTPDYWLWRGNDDTQDDKTGT